MKRNPSKTLQIKNQLLRKKSNPDLLKVKWAEICFVMKITICMGSNIKIMATNLKLSIAVQYLLVQQEFILNMGKQKLLKESMNITMLQIKVRSTLVIFVSNLTAILVICEFMLTVFIKA